MNYVDYLASLEQVMAAFLRVGHGPLREALMRHYDVLRWGRQWLSGRGRLELMARQGGRP